MFIVISCSILAILLTYLNSVYKNRDGMFIGFCLVTFLAMIHYDYGNDYMSYYSVYLEISQYDSISQILKMEVYRDPGWSVVNYLFRYLGGFFSLVAAISVFEGVVYYNAIKRYLPRELWWLGFFLYLFRTSFYLLNFSMLRQGFVVSVFLCVWPWIVQKKWKLSLMVLYLTSFIHGSALILLPFSFFGFLNIKSGKTIAIFMALFVMVLSFSASLVETILDTLLHSSETLEDYTMKYGTSNRGFSFGLGVLIYMIPTIVTWLYLGFSTSSMENKRMAVMALAGALITPFAAVIPMAGRIGLYFAPFEVLVFPKAYMNIKNNNVRMTLLSLYCLIVIYDYFIFFTSDVFSPYYSTFHTIFGQLF